ncbi:glutamate-cysteine ligase family protein [Gordonia sp. i37]|uniref:glutamate-cysteine ligase family protein n=1 Tax=Gordonia sp. i37 TaxID=1961707 RepID=UPI00209BB799|nr:glutamate-cysteine ligase family protein [Gordonia sp. i37]
MPSHLKTLSCRGVREIAAEMFSGCGADNVGVEVEWPVFGVATLERPTMDILTPLTTEPLPADSRITIEPGGQIELSTLPHTSASAALAAVDTDATELRDRLRSYSFTMAECAVDTVRAPQRILDKPRYAAMESFYAARGDEGLWMMANTASVQVNLSHRPGGGHLRWYALNRIGPVLIAMFANSPGLGPDGSRWRSLRQAIWKGIDPGRTRPVPVGDSPVHDWASYALAADVFYINTEQGHAVAPGMSFGDWLTNGHELGWPTADDLRYHLTTLFPPIRPRGWLELRMLDALTPDVRQVAVHVAATAADDEVCARILELPDTHHLWTIAARDGLAHPVLAKGARTLVATAVSALSSAPETSSAADEILGFAEEYTHRGRCPGDDRPDLTVPAFQRRMAATRAR